MIFAAKHNRWLLRSSAAVLVGMVLSGCPFRVESGSAGSNFGPGPVGGDALVVSGDTPEDALDFVFTVEGDLILTDITAPLVSTSTLQAVQGDLIVRNNPELSSLTFRNLTFVGGDIRIEDNARLQNVTLNALEQARGSVVVDDNPVLTFIRIDGARELGGLSVNSPEMNALSFPQLETVDGDVFIGAVAFAGNTSASEVRFDALTSVAGDFMLVNNAQLRFAIAPQLRQTQGAFVLADNPRLSTIDFPALVVADGGVCVCDNQSLDGCEAVALAEQIASEEAIVVEGNRSECID